MKKTNLKSAFKFFLMVQESIKHFPIPLRNWLKVLAGGQFLVIFVIGFAFISLAAADELTQQAKITLPVQESKDSTRIIVTTSGPAKFSSRWLDNPHRLVVEFQTKNIVSSIGSELVVNEGVIKRITSEYYGGTQKNLKSLNFELLEKVPYKIWQEDNNIILDIHASLTAPLGIEGKEVFVKDESKEQIGRRLETMETTLKQLPVVQVQTVPPKLIVKTSPPQRKSIAPIAFWLIGLTLISGLGGLLFWLFWRRYKLILDKNVAVQEIEKLKSQVAEKNKLIEQEEMIRKTIENTSLTREKDFEQLKTESQKEQQLLEQEQKARKIAEEGLSQKEKESEQVKNSLESLKEVLVNKGLAKKLSFPKGEEELWIPGKSSEKRQLPRLDLSKDYNRTIILRIESPDKSKSIKSFANNIGLRGLCFETRRDFEEK
ncbi:MAG: AMIN domain-containing protein, partial [Candidatus Omnitrophota bacterium]